MDGGAWRTTVCGVEFNTTQKLTLSLSLSFEVKGSRDNKGSYKQTNKQQTTTDGSSWDLEGDRFDLQQSHCTLISLY